MIYSILKKLAKARERISRSKGTFFQSSSFKRKVDYHRKNGEINKFLLALLKNKQ